MIDILRVEVLDSNGRYVMVPKLADPHKILKADTDSNSAAETFTDSSGADDSLT